MHDTQKSGGKNNMKEIKEISKNKGGRSMKIAVLAANGRVGRLIVREALQRGHEVTLVVRTAVPVGENPVIEKDIMALTKEDVKEFDVVISTFGVWDETKFGLYSTVTNHLCDILSNTGIRLLIVGGAGSLYIDPEHKVQVLETEGFPAEYKALATAAAKSLAELRQREDVTWTYLSPAGFFDAEGKKSGQIIIGGEEAIVNSRGDSYISYADYAIAMVDEIENATYIQKRFSVVGEQ